MAECVVLCHVCKDDEDGPKRWRYLCEECADDQSARHRKETGHDCEMVITRDAPPKKVFGMIADAGRLMGRRAW